MTVLCAFLTNFCLFLAEEQEGLFSFLPEFFTRSRSLHQGYNLFQSPSSYTRRNKHEEKLVQTGQENICPVVVGPVCRPILQKTKKGRRSPQFLFLARCLGQKNVRIDNNQRRLRRWRTSSSSSAMRSRRSTTMVPPRVESSKSPHSLSSFLTRNMSLI